MRRNKVVEDMGAPFGKSRIKNRIQEVTGRREGE